MEKFEKELNQAAQERRTQKKPAPRENKIRVVTDYCKGCGLCVDICPTGTLELMDNILSKFGVSVKVAANQYCIGCKMCERRCPDFAIFVNYNQTAREKK